ncbi:hypothetical protein HDU91_001741, partial [Kappamyces sp. JEL0680]
DANTHYYSYTAPAFAYGTAAGYESAPVEYYSQSTPGAPYYSQSTVLSANAHYYVDENGQYYYPDPDYVEEQPTAVEQTNYFQPKPVPSPGYPQHYDHQGPAEHLPYSTHETHAYAKENRAPPASPLPEWTSAPLPVANEVDDSIDRNSIQESNPGDFHVHHISTFDKMSDLAEIDEDGKSNAGSDNAKLLVESLALTAAALSSPLIAPPTLPKPLPLANKPSADSIMTQSTTSRNLLKSVLAYNSAYPSPDSEIRSVQTAPKPVVPSLARLQDENRPSSTPPLIPKRHSSIAQSELPTRPVSMINMSDVPSRWSSLAGTGVSLLRPIIPSRGESLLRSPGLKKPTQSK